MSASAPSLTRHVFISYSSKDRDLVERVITDLQARGVVVWIDHQRLRPGTPNWEKALRKAMREASAVLLVASPNSYESDYVQDELAIARMYKLPIYPVWAKGTEWLECVPIGMGKVQYIDAREDAYDTALPQIVLALTGGGIPPVRELVTETPVSPPADFVPSNPYKGLRAFNADDRDKFFGRDKLIAELIAALKENLQRDAGRMLAVVGPSGSGKSSVVMAGLLPRLERGALPGSERWLYLPPIVPGVDPLENLMLALADALPQRAHESIRQDLEAPSARGLHTMSRQIAGQEHGQVVLFVDQFEELFTQTASEEQREQFINLLVTAATEPDGLLVLIVTLRADFSDRPLKYPELGKLIHDHSQPVLPLSLADLYDVVQKPATLPDVQMTFDEGLVGELVFAVRDQAGGLPLLQFALDELFQRREDRRLTWTAYEAIGGVRGALAQHAEAAYQKLPTDQHRHMAKRLFLRLIEPGATEQDTTRHRAIFDELDLPDPGQTRIQKDVAEDFVRERLLVTSQMDHTTTIEVGHEMLIREWKRLGDWLHETREDLRQQKEVNATAVEWDRRGRNPTDDILYRGSVLASALEWAAHYQPSTLEKDFIDVSVTAEGRRAAEERAREQHELELKQALARRRGYLAVVLAVFLVVAIALSLWAFGERGNAQDAANRAETQAQRADMGATVAQTSAYGAATAAAQADAARATSSYNAEANHDQFLAALSLESYREDQIKGIALAMQAVNGNNPPIQAQRFLADVAYPPGPRRLMQGGPDPHSNVNYVTGVDISPDGTQALSAWTDDTVKLWDLETGDLLYVFSGHRGDVLEVVYSPDGRYALSASLDGTLRLWDVEQRTAIRDFEGHESGVNTVAFSPDGKTAISGAQDGTLILWDVETAHPLESFGGHKGPVSGVAFSPDGKSVVSCAAEARVILWDVETGDVKRIFTAVNTPEVRTVAFSPDGKMIAFPDSLTLTFWDVSAGEKIHSFEEAHTGGINSVAFSPDGTLLASGSSDGTVAVWDIVGWKMKNRFVKHIGWVGGVAFGPDNHTILSGASEGALILWDLQRAEVERDDHNGEVTGVAYSPDGRLAASGSKDSTLILWDTSTWQKLKVFSQTDEVWSVAFSLIENRVVCGLRDGSLVLWDVDRDRELWHIREHQGQVNLVSFSPDGRTILSGSWDGTIRLWDVATGAEIYQFQPYPSSSWPIREEVRSLTFLADGHTALSGSDVNELVEWNLLTGEEVRRWPIVPNAADASRVGAWDIAVAPGGQIALLGLYNGTVVTWNIQDGTVIGRLLGHSGTADSVAFSPDGEYGISGSADSTVIVWDLERGEILRRFTLHTGPVLSVGFNPSGKSALSGSADGCLIEWRIDTLDELIQWTYEHRAVRELTCDEREGYQVEPFCDESGKSPMSTPYSTWTPSPTATMTPTPDLTRTTATLTATDTPTLLPSSTNTPTMTPVSAQIVNPGAYRGEIAIGGGQLWTYEGQAGETLIVQVNADNPAGTNTDAQTRLSRGLLDTYVVLYGPDHSILTEGDDIDAADPERTNSMIDYELPVDGSYNIEVRSFNSESGGQYTLVIESRGLAAITPVVTMSPIRAPMETAAP